jgi:two-component system, sensor histidine kinase
VLRELLRRALWPDDAPFLQAQVELILGNLPLAMVGSLIGASIVAAEYMAMTGDTAVWYWCGWVLFISTLLLRLGRRGAAAAREPQVYKTLLQLRVLTLALGLGWCMLVLFFMQTNDPHTTTLVLSAAAGANAGGLMLFAPVWPLTLVYLLVTAPPAAMALLWSGHQSDMVLGSAVLIYTVFLAVFSYHAARTVRESIGLRFEKADLVGQLQEQTWEATQARRLAEDALREAEDANRAKVIFLASASHDLRQPLHALGLFANALGRTSLTGRQRSLLSQVDASAEAARDMLNTLLDFSKVDAGAVTPRLQPFALQPLLHRLELEFAPQAVDQGLVYRQHDTRAVVHSDAALVERILRNLISNALRNTERGGLLVGVRKRGDMAVVEVWDTGVGIPAHQHRAVFKEFHQLGNPERDRRKGLGLGLAIVEGLARSLDTWVSLASVPGRGSVFRLALPLSQEAVVDVAPAVIEEGSLTGARILVIDDDETVRAAMAELFTGWGAWCEVVESAEDAVRLLPTFSPQVLVADYRLRGDRRGHEAIATVRRFARWKVPAVLVTGDTAAERIRDAQASGVALLYKPVSAKQLYQTLVELLHASQVAGDVTRQQA